MRAGVRRGPRIARLNGQCVSSEMIATKEVSGKLSGWPRGLVLLFAAALLCLPVRGQDPVSGPDLLLPQR